MNTIDIFPWDAHFETGLPVVDGQHRRLVALLNGLASQVAYGAHSEVLATLFDELADYTRYHFETEEAIWQQYLAQDPDRSAHLLTHRSFVQEVDRLRGALASSDQNQLAEEALGFLARWLASHILETDRFMACVVLALQQGLALAQAKSRAREQMQGTTRALIDLILATYATLSSNTLRLMRELAARREAQEKLQRESETSRALLHCASDGIHVLDGAGRLVLVSDAFCEMLGYERDELLGMPLERLDVQTPPDALRHKLQTALHSGQRMLCETRHRRRDGHTILVEISCQPLSVGKERWLFGSARDITHRKLVEAALRDSELRYRCLAERSPLAIQVYSPQGRALRVNHAWERLWQTPFSALKDYNVLQDPQLQELGLMDDVRRVFAGESVKFPLHCYDARRNPGGTGAAQPLWLQVHGYPVQDDQNRLLEVVLIQEDVTERRLAEERLMLSASVFTHAREGIVLTDSEVRILDVNDAFSSITGYSREEVLGRNPSLLKSAHHGADFYARMWSDLLAQGHWSGEIWNRRKGGELYAQWLTISAVADANGRHGHYVALFSDITALKEHERQLKQIAHYDALTGLPNRLLLDDRLRQAMTQATRRGQSLALAFLDLDGFKSINDQFGHAAGDAVLMAVTQRMKRILREGDTLARLGGDEFVAVLPDLRDIESSLPLISRLLEGVAQAVMVDDQALRVSASLGITFFPQTQEVDADQLLRQADQAMYQAKLAGKGRYHVFDADRHQSLRERQAFMDEIRIALDHHEFELHYQPKVHLRSGEVLGLEALIRWRHPRRGLLLPAQFLPAIEDHPLMAELGRWTLHSALSCLSVWRRAGCATPVSVNIAAIHLQQEDFVPRLTELLAVYSEVPPTLLELEVVETSALSDMTHVIAVMSACHRLGIRFALDDFGTGYSSLAHLRRLPTQVLKIDQSFVAGMLEEPESLAILEGVMGLALAFKREVIAEGIEHPQQVTHLLHLGCEWGQGFGIARPMPADQWPQWLANWRLRQQAWVLGCPSTGS